MQIKIGADPELFAKDMTGSIVSVHDLLPGTKHDPYPVPMGAVQVDGTAAEFNIEPATTFEQFDTSIVSVVNSMQEMLPGLTLVSEPVAHFDPVYFNGLPPQAVELGCNPDFNAYTMRENPIPDASRMFRTGSGHIHIGWTEGADPFEYNHYMSCVQLVKHLDWYLGYNSLQWDPDNTRRDLYGKPGAFRPKPYGVEYRVLSNKWVLDQRLRRAVWDLTHEAIENLTKQGPFSSYYDESLKRYFNEPYNPYNHPRGGHYDLSA